MDKAIVTYDESRGKILAKYEENFGRVCEVDVTDQALQAVFRYLMAYGLTLAEHCEYEVDGNKFRTSLVKKEPTVDPVKHSEREINADELLKRLDQYFEDNGLEHKWTGDEIADSMSGTVEDIVRIVKEMLGESDDEDEETGWW